VGFLAEVAADGVEALEAWLSGRFALVLTDLHMPRRDGFELLAEIRAQEQRLALRRTPVVAASADISSATLERAQAAGFDRVVLKPTPLPRLSALLRELLPQADFNDAATVPGEPTAASDATAVFDPAALDALDRGDVAARKALLADFVATANSDAAALVRAAATRDRVAVRRWAHRLVGACRLVGALALASALEPLELAAAREDWDAVDAALGPIEQARRALEAVVAG
jgi:CheY-like chemotaxis protein